MLQNKSEDSAARLGYEEVKTCFNEAEELTHIHVNSSIQEFNEVLLTAGKCMKKKKEKKKEKERKLFLLVKKDGKYGFI